MAPRASEWLTEQLDSDEEVLARDAALALGRIGRGARVALPKLIQMSTRGSLERRIAALTAMSAIDGKDPAVFKAVRESLGASAEEVRWSAIEALGVVGHKQAIPLLVKLLDDEDEFARLRACTSLAAIGRTARTAVPALEKRLRKETVNSVSLEAGRAIRTILGINPDR